ncbi:glutathione S- transferase, nitrogen catabolite repression regulator [Kalmusia sp. IMI 367209]|nr:glutathione S- transferase, nitrogen catabolite repression regulator [Kalmusia sp. IMI 367209]
MSTEAIELWGHWGAPNPWKVCMVLEELGLPYTIHYRELSEVKNEDYLKINPNGRLPAIKDPNSGLTLWESGAIILYLIDRYDLDEKLSYKTFPEKYLTQQWLAFQISGSYLMDFCWSKHADDPSGQAPYFGQATWFARFHSQKISSAIDRYVNEVFRVVGVLEKALEANGTGWLVGDRMTYADLSFVTWSSVANGLLKQLDKLAGFEEKFPRYTKWLKDMGSREAVQKIEDQMARGRAEHALP